MRTPKPTTAELAVLRVLWRHGSATVRQVHQELYGGTDVGYTSALKIMQNMHAKGLATRTPDGRQHVYEAAVGESATMNGVVGGWIDSMFSGSSLALAMRALDARPMDSEELAQLKELVARIEADER